MEVVRTLKSPGVAILLCLFLGHFGAHRFYLERKHAVTMLVLTLTIVGLLVSLPWALVDLFRVNGFTRDTNRKMTTGY